MPLSRFMAFGVAWAIVLCLITTIGAHGDALEETALAVYEQHKAAVVTVELVVRQRFAFMGMDSESEESRTETTGTVIDATGLTVVSLSATDPTSMMTNLMGGMLGDDMQIQSEIADVRIIADGPPIPASILLRDKDHDLAFVRPLAPVDPPLPFIDLNQSAQPSLLEALVVIQRMGRVANRVHAVSLSRVKAVVERPRRFYLADTDAIGAPALRLDGRCAGIFVTRVIKSPHGGAGFPMNLLSEIQDTMSIILTPAATILEGAAQAPPVVAGDDASSIKPE
jgi:hypothetical protein